MANVVWEPGISKFAAAILDPREERKIKLLYARWENIYGVRIGFIPKMEDRVDWRGA